MKRIIRSLFIAGLVFGVASAWAAKAPLSPEQLKKQALHILSGSVVEVSSNKQKSKVEKAFGIHTDRIYTIKLKVTGTAKGAGVAVGQEIEVEAWKPVRRWPALPGLQGHSSIPKKGDAVTVYAAGKTGAAFKPLLPNGIRIEPVGPVRP